MNVFDCTLPLHNRQGARDEMGVLKGLNWQSDVTRVTSWQSGTIASIG